MKKHVLTSLAVASLLATVSFSSVGVKRASADYDNLRYYTVETVARSVTSETIPCTSINETETVTQYRMPLYTATGDLTNCCGAVAGSIIVGFYDRYYPDLIPNWTPYFSNNMYKYADTTYVPAVMEELYVLMRTNVDDVGVSQYDCRDGLQEYFNDRGRNLSYSSIETSSQFNYQLYKQAIQANKPVLMFCTELTISFLVYSNSQSAAVFTHQDISGAHIIVGYGYTTVNYYNGDTIFRSEEYLLVSTGRDGFTDAYVNISSTDWLVDGYAVTVS